MHCFPTPASATMMFSVPPNLYRKLSITFALKILVRDAQDKWRAAGVAAFGQFGVAPSLCVRLPVLLGRHCLSWPRCHCQHHSGKYCFHGVPYRCDNNLAARYETVRGIGYPRA